jgi:hypothetical protein
MSDIDKFHSLAKDSGNKLRAYILSVASGGTGLFFLTLTKPEITNYSTLEKCLLLTALLGFVLTVVLSLYELRIDAKRFFIVAKELEKEESKQNWCENENMKKKRLLIINFSYFTLGVGILALTGYLALKLTAT